MLVTAIFVILSGVVLANNSRFGNVIVLQNLAHDIALSIRQAQVYGIAVRGQGANFDLAYGTHFQNGVASFELFADADNSGVWDPGETVLSSTIAAGYRVSDLCVTRAVDDVELCGRSEMNITFRRPEPDACIDGAFDSDGDCISIYGGARIVVHSNRDDTAEVLVQSTGQISAQ